MTDPRYDAIVKLLGPLMEAREKATPGKWFSGFHKTEASVYKEKTRNYKNRICDLPTWGANAPDDECCQSHEGAKNNAAFIALAANTVSQIKEILEGEK